MSELAMLRKKLRKALAEYMWSEGCSCCESTDNHAEHKETLAKLLNVPKYPDGSGYDFDRYRAKAEAAGVGKSDEV